VEEKKNTFNCIPLYKVGGWKNIVEIVGDAGLSFLNKCKRLMKVSQRWHIM